MSETQRVEILDVADAYLRATSPDGATFTVQDRHFVSEAIYDLVDDENPLEAYAIVELDDNTWALLLTADRGAALLTLREFVVEARVLGALRGVYREEWTFEEGEVGPVLTMTFEDARLPGGSLAIRIDPPPRPGAFPDSRAGRAREMKALIRARLREWAVSPPP